MSIWKTTFIRNYTTGSGQFSSGHSRFLLMAGVSLLLSATLPSCKDEKKPAAETTDKEKYDSLASANIELQAKYDAAGSQIDNYATKAVQLDSLIRQKDAQIAKLNNEKKLLEQTNKKLAGDLKASKKLIASLKDELSDNAKSYESKLGALENDRNDLLRQRDSLVAKYNHVVALGSVLHASNIRITAIRFKKHGTVEKNTKRARRADALKVDFDIDENRIAEDGTKQLYLVIKDPEGNLLSNTAAGSGITTTTKGKQLSYSILKEIALVKDTPVKNVTVDWKQEGDYERGDYTIDIYNGGYRIGSAHVALK